MKVTVTKTCKFCKANFTVTDTLEEIRWILNCCVPCFEDDAPGMARFERMQATETEFAINNS